MIRWLVAIALLWPALGWADYNSVIQADVPCFYYHLDESSGTTANDSHTGACVAQSGTYTGGFTLSQSGIPGYPGNTAVSLNGSTGYVAFTGNLKKQPPIGAGASWSFEMWINPTSLQTAALGAMNDPAATNYVWELFTINDGTVKAILNTCGGGNFGVIQGGTYTANAWNYVVMTTFDLSGGSQRLRLYVNGTLISTLTSFSGSFCTVTNEVDLGRRPDNLFFFAGRLDEPAFYHDGGGGTAELTQTQVTTHLNCGSGVTCGAANGGMPFSVKRDRLQPPTLIERSLPTFALAEPTFVVERLNRRAIRSQSQYAEAAR